jgi:hypothetical protein
MGFTTQIHSINIAISRDLGAEDFNILGAK